METMAKYYISKFDDVQWYLYMYLFWIFYFTDTDTYSADPAMQRVRTLKNYERRLASLLFFSFLRTIQYPNS